MVPFFKILLSLTGLLQVIACLALSSPFRSGFHLPDSVEELTIKYKTVGNLILLPVSINDTIQVNLILDTGTRNLVLFGKRFKKDFDFLANKKVQFSGLGNGSPVFGKLSINNKVKINSVIGLDIPIVVVPNRNLFGSLSNVHGVVGYEIFQKFEIEINPLREEITFRSPMHKRTNDAFIRVPLAVKDCKPILDCEIFLEADQRRLCDLLLDTGSEFGLLMKSKDDQWVNGLGKVDTFGRGFNGAIEGVEIQTNRVQVENISFEVGPSRMIRSPWHDYASIGMGILSQYIIILNYAQGYVKLKKI
jgi:hypothetical protein